MLQVGDFDPKELGAPESAPDQNGQDSPVILAAYYLYARACREILRDVNARKSDPQWPCLAPYRVGDLGASWVTALTIAQKGVHHAIEHLFNVKWRIPAGLLLAVLLFHLVKGTRGLEDSGWFRYWALCLGILPVSAACFHMLLTTRNVWRRLQTLLKLLDAGPIRESFQSLSGEDVQAKVWAAITDGRSYQLHILTIK